MTEGLQKLINLEFVMTLNLKKNIWYIDADCLDNESDMNPAQPGILLSSCAGSSEHADTIIQPWVVSS